MVEGSRIEGCSAAYGGAISVWDGSCTMAQSSIVNCTASANGFFGNVRIPAALLSGVAMGQLYAKAEAPHCPKWVPGAFSALVALTVMCELWVVATSTIASTKLSLLGGFNPMATDPTSFLIREMEFQYVSVRASFFIGLLSFIASIALRVWAFVPGPLGHGLAFGIVSVQLQLLAFFNSTVVNYPMGLLGLMVRTVQLFFTQVAPTPIGAVSLLCCIGSIAYLIQYVVELKPFK